MKRLESKRDIAIDGEIGDLRDDLVSSTPLIAYHRYDLSLTPDIVGPLMPELSLDETNSLRAMDQPENLDMLRGLGVHATKQQVGPEHFPDRFDLTD